VKPTVDKVKAIVEFFHRSTVATEKLKSTQRQMGMAELRPKQECATRWNSTFYMLKGILESKDAIISTLAVINAPVDTLSHRFSNCGARPTSGAWRNCRWGAEKKKHFSLPN